MENFPYYSYLAASAAYFLLLLWFLLGIKKNPITPSVIAAIVFSLLWSGYTAFVLHNDNLSISSSLPFETLRNAAWFFLLNILISRQQFNSNYTLLRLSRTAHILVLFIIGVFILEISSDTLAYLKQFVGEKASIRLSAHLLFAVIGLVLIEQLYRNAVAEFRWAIKFLCLSLSAIFAVDIIVYSKSLLFVQIDSVLWNSRGVLNALITPLLAIALHRLQTNTAGFTVSRTFAFHSTVLLSASAYLILMSMAGFYIRDYGGNWGKVAQIVFIFSAGLLLLALSSSGKVRALLKVYLSKHFFHYRYDYRDEWLKLSRNIAELKALDELSALIIKTMTGLADCSGGGLWLRNEQGNFYLSEQRNLGFDSPPIILADSSLITFMAEKKWVVDLLEFSSTPDHYANVDLSYWSAKDKRVWLIVPLFLQNTLNAFIVLTQAKVPRILNWEDHDILKTIGMQLANVLALNKASDALSQAKQFEAYNRISAYLVHDLKNLVAQISLIVKNSEKHRHNPEFIDDSIATLENVVSKIDHILGQLKKGGVGNNQKSLINLADIIDDAALQQSANTPRPECLISDDGIEIIGEKTTMTAILGHLVQNAQDATADSGFVRLELSKNEPHAIIKIIDNGVGMDDKFIAERLFKPFDTTKGNAGMGIGVYEARDYILKNGGSFIVESVLGVGTTFVIKLPLANYPLKA
ncbi:MAG: PEP-CTERM system histidine kinase PrsK [Methylovulum sp.]|nr:PEP-CTERM system histidine kinase PrsK [Methylovulum sp.]